MIKNVLVHMGGIEVYGVASILIFFAVFIGMLLWAFRIKRTHLESMSQLPLSDDSRPPAPMNCNLDSDSDSDPSHE